MAMGNLVRTALKAMGRNVMRTLLTMLGIIIGVASVISMLALGLGSQLQIQSQISEMGSNMLTIMPAGGRRGGVRMEASATVLLSSDDAVLLEEEAHYLSDVSPFLSTGGQVVSGPNNWPTQLQGVAPAYLNIRKLQIKEGVAFTVLDIKQSAKVCLVGQTVVENLFPDGRSAIGQILRVGAVPLRIIGVLEQKGSNTFGQDQDDVVLLPYSTMQKRMLAVSHVHSIYASAVSENLSDKAVEEVEMLLSANSRLISNGEPAFEVRSQKELIAMFSSTSEMMTLLLAAVAGISLLVGGIGIMNVMFMSVTERTREIGLRMAVGGRSLHIMLQFLMEALMVSFGGGLLGVILGLGASAALDRILGWPVSVSETSVLLSFGVCTVIGVFFGWYPARKAAALDPIAALRYE